MKYGYFDDKNKEYVVTSPNTPSPWVNYLGTPLYGAIISNNATGYSFKESGAKGRVIRHKFNSMSNDAPGRYIYIKDLADNDYWSSSWAPVCKPTEQFKSECHHGMGYTTIVSVYKNIKTETTYFVPTGETYEVWKCTVTNLGDTARDLSVTGCCSFVNHSSFIDDQVDLQCSLFLTSTALIENIVYQTHRLERGVAPMERFFSLADAKVDAFCGDRDSFLGLYRGYQNPEGIEKGLGGQTNFNGNSVGAIQSNITLKPQESKTFTYLLGQESLKNAKTITAKYKDGALANEQLQDIKSQWNEKLDSLEVETPDKNFNSMINVWNAYNCYMTFTWSRAASLIYCGLRNGYGYRDTVQDIQGIIHLNPALAKEKIRFMLSAQTAKGAGLPLVKFTHNAGFENTPDEDDYIKETGHPAYRSDDALWLFPTIKKYIGETGDTAFLDEKIVYANQNTPVTVYDHLKKAIEFTLNNFGDHSLPLQLHADWNDSLGAGAGAESVFVAFQLVLALDIISKYAAAKNDTEYLKELDKAYKKVSAGLNTAFEGDRYIRAYRADGKKLGSKDSVEASFWLNPQTWSVISNYGDEQTRIKVMDGVFEKLNTPYGAKLFDIPYGKEDIPGKMGMSYYNDYTKENASIFCQTQGWLILAEALLGRGDRAYKYWKEINPAEYNERAELRTLEPYVFGQFTEATGSPFAGRSHVHWLTGTASTVMVGAVEGILGLRPEADGLVINPSIPGEWDGFKMKKIFRGKTLFIEVKNPEHKQSGVSKIFLNGKQYPAALIQDSDLTDNAQIEIILG